MANSSGDANKFDGWCHTKVETTHFTYSWTIENFSFLQKKVCEKVISAEFTVATPDKETVWRLNLYPNGEKAENAGSLSLFLCPVNPQVVELFATYSFYVLNLKKEQVYKMEVTNNFTNTSGYGLPCWIKRSDLMDKRSELLPNDQLTICCDLTISQSTSMSTTSGQSQPVSLQTENHLFEDMKSLLKSELLTDVTLVVREKEFRAHKVILAARSPVFAAMFVNEMIEKDDNVVNITDTEVDAFENVLDYMYTGKVPTLDNRQTVQDILYAANKYDLDHLKMSCAVALSKMITADSAAEILVLAEMHSLDILKDKVREYIVKNTEVFETPAWKLVEENHLDVALEIFHACFTSPKKCK